jgi:hypothetical protein
MDIAGGRFLVTGGASLIGSHLTQQLPGFCAIKEDSHWG